MNPSPALKLFNYVKSEFPDAGTAGNILARFAAQCVGRHEARYIDAAPGRAYCPMCGMWVV